MFLPTFHTDRLILKPVSILDYHSYQKHFAHFEIIGQLSERVPWPYPENGAYQFISNFVMPRQGKNFWMWRIFLKNNPSDLIGVVNFHGGDAIYNRGFWLSQELWGQGLMTEAVQPLTSYAFTDLGFSELKLSNAVGNLRSRRIKEKQGATFLRVKEAKLVNPEITQVEEWVLSKEIWLKNFSS